MTERFFAITCLVTVSSRIISRSLTLINLRNPQYASYPNTLIYAPFFFILVRLYPCSFMTMYAYVHLNIPQQILIMVDSLNSRVHIRSRLTRGGGNTTTTITQEQIIDGNPFATSRLHINPNGDVLAMMAMSKQKRPGDVERVVGFDESTAV